MKNEKCVRFFTGSQSDPVLFLLSLSLSLCSRKEAKIKKGANFFPSLSSKRNSGGEREKERERDFREREREERFLFVSFSEG